MSISTGMVCSSRIGLDAPRDLEPVHARHAVVDDDRVRQDLPRQAQPLLAGQRGNGVIPAALEEALGDLQVVRVVVDDDDALALLHAVLREYEGQWVARVNAVSDLAAR